MCVCVCVGRDDVAMSAWFGAPWSSEGVRDRGDEVGWAESVRQLTSTRLMDYYSAYLDYLLCRAKPLVAGDHASRAVCNVRETVFVPTVDVSCAFLYLWCCK